MKRAMQPLLIIVACLLLGLITKASSPPPVQFSKWIISSLIAMGSVFTSAFFLSLLNKLSTRYYKYWETARHIMFIIALVVILDDVVLPSFSLFNSYDVYFYAELLMTSLVLILAFNRQAHISFPQFASWRIHSATLVLLMLFYFVQFNSVWFPSSENLDTAEETLAIVEPMFPWSFSAVTPQEYFHSLDTVATDIQKDIDELPEVKDE